MFPSRFKCIGHLHRLASLWHFNGAKELSSKPYLLMTGTGKVSAQLFVASFVILGLGLNSIWSTPVEAQQSGLTGKGRSILGSQYVPSDAVLVSEVEISATLASPQLEMYPIEIVDAWSTEYLGVSARKLENLRLVVAAPGPGDPEFAVILSSKETIKLGKASDDFIDIGSPLQVDQRDCFPVVDAPGVVLHQFDSKTLIFATEGYLDVVLRASKPSSNRGALAKLADSTPTSANATVIATIEPVRAMAMGIAQSMAGRIPPPLQPFTQMPVLLDAVMVGLDMAEAEGTIEVSLKASDDGAATRLKRLISDGLEFGRQIALAEMVGELDPSDPMTAAMIRYMQRLSGLLVTSVMPEQNGDLLTIKGSPSQAMATQGVLVSLLLPAVQSARQAARRVSTMNNLKQVGLAMHNYHSVYREFPGDILAADGTPLLSWRVAILPFVDQSELYKQFRQDEPWNSPHNLKLMEKMPPVYRHPEMRVGPNRTVYQRPLGPNFIFEGHEGIAMAEVLDGLSNTIMVVESDADAAVEWSKPADRDVDLSDVVGSTGGWARDGFSALIADGSVRFISTEIQSVVLRALLTRSGGEVVEDF